jgi:hypothetical protein
MFSCKNAFCAVLVLANTSTALRAGELVQFDAVSADAGRSGSSAISRARSGRRQVHPLPSLFSMAAAVLMISSSPGRIG